MEKVLNKKKSIVTAIIAVIFFITGPTVSVWQISKLPNVTVGMSKAEAINLGGLANVAADFMIPKTAKSVLKHLSKASIQMAYAKIKMAEAVGMEPEKIQGARQAMLAIIRSPNDLNAIRTSAQLEISEVEIERRISSTMNVTDQNKSERIKALWSEANLARHAAHKNNAAAIAKAVVLTGLIAKRTHDNPKSMAKHLATFLVVATVSQQLMKDQSKRSDELKRITKEFDSRWSIKEPTDSDVKKFEKKLDKELQPQ